MRVRRVPVSAARVLSFIRFGLGSAVEPLEKAPEDLRIVGVEYNGPNDIVYVFVESESFEEIDDPRKAPDWAISVRRVEATRS